MRKYLGFRRARLLNGWAVSGITTFQTGFPIRITSSADNELMYSFDFELPGEPDQLRRSRHRTRRRTATTSSIPIALPRMHQTTVAVRTAPRARSTAFSRAIGHDWQRAAHHLLRTAHQQHRFRHPEEHSGHRETSTLNSGPNFSICSTTRSSSTRTATPATGRSLGRVTQRPRSAPDTVCFEILSSSY